VIGTDEGRILYGILRGGEGGGGRREEGL